MGLYMSIQNRGSRQVQITKHIAMKKQHNYYTCQMNKIYKLRDWINPDKLDWQILSFNPNAIELLERFQDKIN